MTEEEALRWMRDVGGTLFHNKRQSGGENAWVAMVRTPQCEGRAGKIILAFGESLGAAAKAAASKWEELWVEISSLH
jgi:hypothetical protein